MTTPPRSNKRKWVVRLLAATATLAVAIALFRGWLFASYWRTDGREALNESNLDEALAALEQAREWDPSSQETEFLLGRVYRRLGDFGRMETHLVQSEKLGLPVERVRVERLLARAQSGALDDFTEPLGQLLMSRSGDEREICRAFVNGMCIRLQFDDALRVLEAWHSDLPDDPEPWFLRGAIQRNTRKWAAAEEAYREGLALAPNDVQARLALAQCQLEQNDVEEAAGNFQRCLERSPRMVEAEFGLGRCRAMQGDITEARRLFLRVVEETPSHEGARHELARLELEAKNYEKAIGWLKDYSRQDALRPETAQILSRAYAALGDEAESKKYLQKFQTAQANLDRLEELFDEIPDHPNDAERRFEIGLLTFQYYSRDEGIAWIESALRLDPGHRKAREFLETHRRGNPNSSGS